MKTLAVLAVVVSVLIFAHFARHSAREAQEHRAVLARSEIRDAERALIEPASQEPVREPASLSPSAALPEEHGSLAPSSTQAVLPDVSAECLELHRENATLKKRVEWLEVELSLCGSEVTKGAIGEWLSVLRIDERPDAETLRTMAYLLAEYPGVRLAVEEGLWIAERVKAKDWKSWAPTIDEALIMMLGADRIAREVPPTKLEELREDWQDEGYFDR
jgi:hypothetical protein